MIMIEERDGFDGRGKMNEIRKGYIIEMSE